MSFKDFELLNLVRHVEQQGSEDLRSDLAGCAPKIETELQSQAISFPKKALSRARQLAEISGLSEKYSRASRRYTSVTLVLYLLMAALGFFAVQQTLAASKSELNVYWLLLILIGVNSVSMLLWLAFIARSLFSRTNARNQSPLLIAFKRGQRLLSKQSSEGSLFSAWNDVYLSGRVGQWFTSKQLHAAWLMYLCGGLAALTITLAGKQYDFVWGTTILSSNMFVQTTEILGALPKMLGFSVPDTSQILASKLGDNREVFTELRTTWASFVVSCILIYALLPRLAFWCWSWLATIRAQSKYQPDWDLPYFYSLRAKMLPQSTSFGVVDADQQPGMDLSLGTQSSSSTPVSLESLNLPDAAYVAAFEWGSAKMPAITLKNATYLGEINTANDQMGMLQAVRQSPQAVVLIVALERAADRGATRFLRELSNLADLHLVVIKTTNTNSEAARFAGWQAVAEKTKLPLTQLYLAEIA